MHTKDSICTITTACLPAAIYSPYTLALLAALSDVMEFCVVDAFTSVPFAGNQACVVLLAETKDAEFMQKFARLGSF